MPVPLTVETIQKMGEVGLMMAVKDQAMMQMLTEVLAQAGFAQEGTHGGVTEVKGKPVQPVVVWTMDDQGREKTVQTYFFPK
ncbi:MAG: hypothetical protein A3B41_03600 [Candidatus Levybacteria bacterium RIFCSPLOWO2_01_FULL_37_26]|nr:MAG: hypothetical protein A3B41_03600 [Candidatus Levybacteria bacterium RIFCSPLOWO2_01_FULL_37_26]